MKYKSWTTDVDCYKLMIQHPQFSLEFLKIGLKYVQALKSEEKDTYEI